MYTVGMTRRVIMPTKSLQRGISLIEVLVAVLMFSVGLIGLVDLMVMAMRANQAAYQRTQVTFLADGMADRMRANALGVWRGRYNGKDYPVPGTTNCERAACTSASLAMHDRQVWSSLLTAFLPDPAAAISCTTASSYIPTADQLTRRPP